jgi:DNA-binding response OmpR family regulator
MSIAVDPVSYSVAIGSSSCQLTRREFEIFSYLVERQGGIASESEIVKHVFGTHHETESSLVRVHIHAIRTKLGDMASCIERVRGAGYRMKPDS